MKRLHLPCRLGVLLSICLLGSIPSWATEPNAPHCLAAETSAEGGSPVPAACEDGVIKDDGSVDTGWGWVPSVLAGEYVQVYDRSEFSSGDMRSVCVCWLRTRPDDSIDFEVVFYADSEGQPAAEPFAVVPAHAENVPQGIVGQFYEVDVSGVRLPDEGTIYIGPRWDASADQFFFVCADTNKTTPFTNVFFTDDRANGEWDNIAETQDPIFIPHRAILVRPVARPAAVIEIPTLGPRILILLIGLLCVLSLFGLRRYP